MALAQCVKDESGQTMYMCPICGGIWDNEDRCEDCCLDPEWPRFTVSTMLYLLNDLLMNRDFNRSVQNVYSAHEGLSDSDMANLVVVGDNHLDVTMPDGGKFKLTVERLHG